MRVEKETRAVCLAQGLDGEALDIYWFLPFYFCRCPSDPSDRRLIFLKLLLLSCYPPTPGFKHETRRSILINSVDEDFSIFFFYYYHHPISLFRNRMCFYFLFYFSITVDIQYYVSVRCTA